MPLLNFNTSVANGVPVVALEGELDVAGSEILEKELARIVREQEAPTIVLDLSRLEFIDSTGLRLVVLADARAREQGRRLALVRGSDSVQRVFEVTRMVERLDFVESPGSIDGREEDGAG